MPLVNGIVNMFLCHPHINQTLPQIIHILQFINGIESPLNYGHYFLINWMKPWLFGGHKSVLMNAQRLAALSCCTWLLFRHFRPRSRCIIRIIQKTGRDPYFSLSMSDVLNANLGLPLSCLHVMLHVSSSFTRTFSQ